VDNFDVVLALARTALGGNREAILHQMQRLIERLDSEGATSEAKSLKLLANKTNRAQAIDPVDFTMSSVEAGLERLGLRTALPVDRDTGAPLCEVAFPAPLRPPLLADSAMRAVDGLREEWVNRARLASAGLPASRSVLLFGPPGTGKTSLAMYLASELGLPAVVARLDGLVSSLLGNTARNLASLFDFCNRYETVLILDEFDAVAKVRDDPNEVGEIKRVVNALLQNLDRRLAFGLTIGITNHETLLDVAIWRRFEHQIYLGLPDGDIRTEIARSVLVHLSDPEPLSKAVAWASSGTSGADTRTLALAAMKTYVLAEENSLSQIDVLRNATRGSAPRVLGRINSELSSPDSDLAQSMFGEQDPPIGVSELAQLFGRDRRTMTRWLHEEGDDIA
jgi:hypothetical protein